MNTTFQCYESIIIENPDSSSYAGVFSGFTYVDFTPYGGGKFTSITSNQDILDVFNSLNIPVKLDGFKIVILNTLYPATNLTSFLNPTINFIDSSDQDICITGETRFDLSFYGGNQIEFFYNKTKLKSRLKELTGSEITMDNCTITLDKFEGIVKDIKVEYDPTFYFTYMGSNISFDFNLYNSVDLTPYGGSIVSIHSGNDLEIAMASLGIDVTFDTFNPILNEYIGVVYPVEVCLIDKFKINELTFDKVHFTPELGGTQLLNNVNDVKSYLLNNYNIETLVMDMGDSYEFTVISPVCTEIEDINTDLFNIPTANPDIIPTCILSGEDYIINILGNDSNIDGESVYKINGEVVLQNSVVNIKPNLNIKNLGDGYIEIISTNNYVSSPSDSVTYTIINNDGIEVGSYFEFCISDIPVINFDTVLIDCNGDSGLINVLLNDYTAYNDLVITHINGIEVLDNSSLNIVPGIDIINVDVDQGFTISASNNYVGSGLITYRASNGAFSDFNYVEYTIPGCDPCLVNNITFPTTTDCAELCWTDLFNNGSAVTNYVLQFRDSSNNIVKNAVGDTIKIAKGSYFNSGSTLPYNSCIPFRAGDYSIEILNSDIGDNLRCSSLDFTMLPMPCSSDPCTFGYSGSGGIASSLNFDVEVGPGAVLTVVKFDPVNAPDGLVIEYNGNVIYHTGASATMPYISSNQTSFTCNGITYISQVAPDPTNLEITIPYVNGVDTALVSILGNPCAGTAWTLILKCEV